ncbi:MAG: hypothetical protein PHZ04_01920 [Patescibacteria group bacterium]|nr:hypothetical protein [Patescibacteria group bacterium]MDD5554822.1 hypothetical protein [Patescibacteria group bacterium]
MVSPYLMKKQEGALTLSESIRRLFQVIYKEQKEPEPESENVQKIKVSEVISKMAFYYEKIRNSVDYKEENLLRKNAVERIMKRQIVIEGAIKVSTSEEIAKDLLVELIRAGYLPNNAIPEEKIKEIAGIIEKYLKLRNYSLARIGFSEHVKNGKVGQATGDFQEINDLTNWFMSLAASEIEESLGRDKIKQAVVTNMYEILIKKVKLPPDLPYEKDKEIQIYLSIHRNFLKFDQEMLEFILFKYFNSGWVKDPGNEDIAKISQSIRSLRQAISAGLNHPLAKQLDKIVSQYSVYFSVLEEVIEKNPASVYDEIKNDIKAFPRLIKKACAGEYKSIKLRLWRAAIRSIIYIFLTKSIFVILLEIPAIQWFGEKVNPVSLIINVSFPALLLFLIVLFTRIPSERNTARIIEKIEEITFVEKERKEQFVLRKPAKRGKLANAFFGLIYFITFFLSFGLIVWALDKINFTWVSIIIFLFFLALVSFFSIRIRRGVKAFIVVEEKENVFTFLVDFFYTPIIAAGQWLSEKFSQINIFIFVLDFIIEAPFKIFVEITEDWTKYVRERREEIK